MREGSILKIYCAGQNMGKGKDEVNLYVSGRYKIL
jgi:hypothetical protein